MSYLGHMTSTNLNPQIPEFDLADRCVKARQFGGFKRQDDLAERSGISIRTISRYESGETKKPNRSIVAQWALACGVPFNWLMYGLAEGDADEGEVQSPWTVGYAGHRADAAA